jgi:DNA repair protein RadC
MKLKELPKIEKPREKLRQKGAAALTNAELLALIVRSGISKVSVMELGEELARLLDKEPESLKLDEIAKLPGVGEAKAASILAALELGRRRFKENKTEVRISKPDDTLPFLQDLRKERRECLKVLYLNTKNEVLQDELVSVGSLNYSLVHPREVFYPAIKISAASIILAHNHPSGSLEPSSDDLNLTQKLLEAGKILGIAVLDHIVIGKDNFVSMKEAGLI